MRNRLDPSRRLALLSCLLVLALVAALPSGCARPHDTAAELQVQIERYRKDPSDALATRIDASFARLDADIAEIRADATTKSDEAKAAALARADALETRRDELRKEYYGARVEAAAHTAKDAVKQFGQSVGKSIEDAGQKIQGAMKGDEAE